jgi:hypothetical protein
VSYSEAFARPNVYGGAGVRYGAVPRRHTVSIRATGAKDIRVSQANNGGNAFLKGALSQSITVKTLKKQRGQRADSPAKLRIRVFWKAGGNEWFDASVSSSTSLTFIPSPGMAGTDPEPQSAESGGGYADAMSTTYTETDTTYEPDLATPWTGIILGSLGAAAVGFLGFRALRGGGRANSDERVWIEDQEDPAPPLEMPWCYWCEAETPDVKPILWGGQYRNVCDVCHQPGLTDPGDRDMAIREARAEPVGPRLTLGEAFDVWTYE